ncbi:MAG TPA: hypothetical protein VKM55_15470 [Candidatus Lokiarchaeia archaeon]|nr:hypothetical protein [Candidatus Lokiarchaeia archaeon]
MLSNHCDDNLVTAPTYVVPVCIAGAVLSIAIAKPRANRRGAPRPTGERKTTT